VIGPNYCQMGILNQKIMVGDHHPQSLVFGGPVAGEIKPGSHLWGKPMKVLGIFVKNPVFIITIHALLLNNL